MEERKKKSTEELEKEIESLKDLAYRDELTGLYNRRGFKDAVGKFIAAIKREKEFDGEPSKSVFIKDFSLIFFDIDNFKKLNDKYGHDAGDEALKFFSGIILENIRDIDSAGRWGGEELVIGLIGASEDDAFNVADRIRKSVSDRAFEFQGKKIKFSVSGGVASFTEAQNFDEIISLSDKALYRAKNEGKNKIIKVSDL